MDGHSKSMQTFETTGGKNINKTKQKNSKKREKQQLTSQNCSWQEGTSWEKAIIINTLYCMSY